jgi:hypothetical protein
MLVRLQVDDAVLLSLRVQHGTEVFAFMTKDSADAQARLIALAKAVLENLS